MTLEKRIETAIAENTDPFTTDADIRFFETEELKTFMEDLWGAEGDFINTPIGRGRIENVRTKVGIDLEVMVRIANTGGIALFNGMELFEINPVRRSCMERV